MKYLLSERCLSLFWLLQRIGDMLMNFNKNTLCYGRRTHFNRNGSYWTYFVISFVVTDNNTTVSDAFLWQYLFSSTRFVWIVHFEQFVLLTTGQEMYNIRRVIFGNNHIAKLNRKLTIIINWLVTMT